ncbi:hypothetical protein QCE47_27990 [Caballeronia sp. LZ025]|nr:hypothetical protein [Caballeronia sp. LZ025]MDR5736158.1 hypothetical protein [Caballeronia sp. LZ025]
MSAPIPFSVAAFDLLDAKTPMKASQTQIDAYHNMSSKQISAKQQMVLDVFDGDKSVTLTREEISSRTNLKLSSVCGRVHELVQAGNLAVRGSVKCVATGNRQQLIGLPIVGN